MWVLFDLGAFDFYREKPKKFPKYKYDENRTADKRAANFEELSNDVCNDIRNHWKNEAQHKQWGHIDHIARFRQEEVYQNAKYQ